MKFLPNKPIRLKSLVVLAVVFALGLPFIVNAATECSVGNTSGLKVNGQCVFFSKGEDMYSEYGCSAQNPSGYGVSMFPCPKELLTAYDEKISAEQAKIDAEKKEAERLADEQLNKKIQDAVAEQIKQNEKKDPVQTVPAQASAILEPTKNSQPTTTSIPIEIKAKPTIPVESISKDSSNGSGFSASTSVDTVPNNQKEIAPVSLWSRFSVFVSRLNPFSWFK
ncbi:MAG: hypothetical protein WA014_01185 [Minisyncoccia bacterium]